MKEALLYCVLQILNHGPQSVACHQHQSAVTAAYAIQEATTEYPTVPAPVVAAVMYHESGFDPRARGAAGEIGLLQLLRGGALEGRLATLPEKTLFNPRVNVLLGVRHMAQIQQRCGGLPSYWLARYNGGPCRRGSSYATKVLSALKRVLRINHKGEGS